MADTISNCCQNFDANTAQTCVLCKGAICENCLVVFENQKICQACGEKVTLELQREVASTKDIPMAILGGFVGASLGALIWATIAIISNTNLGFVAIGVGFLAGQGVSIAVAKRKALFLQVISAVFGFFGILLGYSATLAYFVVENVKKEGGNISYFDSQLFTYLIQYLPKTLSLFSFVFLAIAIYYAWKISAPNAMHAPVIRKKKVVMANTFATKPIEELPTEENKKN